MCDDGFEVLDTNDNVQFFFHGELTELLGVYGYCGL